MSAIQLKNQRAYVQNAAVMSRIQLENAKVSSSKTKEREREREREEKESYHIKTLFRCNKNAPCYKNRTLSNNCIL